MNAIHAARNLITLMQAVQMCRQHGVAYHCAGICRQITYLYPITHCHIGPNTSQVTEKQRRDMEEAGMALPKPMPTMYEAISADEDAVLKTIMQVGEVPHRWRAMMSTRLHLSCVCRPSILSGRKANVTRV